ncbi:MAG: helix-turn-helix transcriptional regulator [Chloroflexota bacterium]|nr:helix-turn-helix transcriptional regulator [Chloroflexota bacterium]
MPRTSYSEVHSKALGVRLRATRERLGLSQAEIARRLKAQPPYVAAVEAGRVNVTIGQLGRIASALGVGFDIEFKIPAREYRTLTHHA